MEKLRIRKREMDNGDGDDIKVNKIGN